MRMCLVHRSAGVDNLDALRLGFGNLQVGIAHARMKLPILSVKPIRFLFLPDGEDPDSFIRKHGKEGFEGRVRESLTLSGFLLSELRAQSALATPEGRSRFLASHPR